MKYLALLGALAIVYLVVAQMGSTHTGVKSAVAQAESEAAKVDPSKAGSSISTATPAAAKTSLRQPIDRARALNAVVKQRNGNGEF